LQLFAEQEKFRVVVISRLFATINVELASVIAE